MDFRFLNKIVESLGGRISVNSIKGKQTKFTFTVRNFNDLYDDHEESKGYDSYELSNQSSDIDLNDFSSENDESYDKGLTCNYDFMSKSTSVSRNYFSSTIRKKSSRSNRR